MSINEVYAIVGPFVPGNDPMTLIPYKQLRGLNSNVFVATLRFKVDPTIDKKLQNDPLFKKFKILNFGIYNNCVFSIHNVNLFKALFCRFLYVNNVVKWYKKNPKDVIYSSAFPQFNHSAALKIKEINPSVRWVANFTDPINHSPYKYDERTYNNYSFIEKIAFQVYCHFYVVDDIEAECFEKADALIFICVEQRDFMIKQYERFYNRISRATILEKSYICPLNYIDSWESSVKINAPSTKKAKIIIGHFGRVYGLRLIEEFIYAIDKLYKDYPHYRNRIEFQQYGEFQKSDLKLIKKLGLSDTFVINSKLDYEDYMRALDGCDYLLILDTILKDDEIQPYLPSKILEYSLLKKNTLSITTKTSPLYRICKNSEALVASYDRYDIEDKLITMLNGTKSVINYACENSSISEHMNKIFFNM